MVLDDFRPAPQRLKLVQRMGASKAKTPTGSEITVVRA